MVPGADVERLAHCRPAPFSIAKRCNSKWSADNLVLVRLPLPGLAASAIRRRAATPTPIAQRPSESAKLVSIGVSWAVADSPTLSWSRGQVSSAR